MSDTAGDEGRAVRRDQFKPLAEGYGFAIEPQPQRALELEIILGLEQPAGAACDSPVFVHDVHPEAVAPVDSAERRIEGRIDALRRRRLAHMRGPAANIRLDREPKRPRLQPFERGIHKVENVVILRRGAADRFPYISHDTPLGCSSRQEV
jgi:hypothetical protein